MKPIISVLILLFATFSELSGQNKEVRVKLLDSNNHLYKDESVSIVLEIRNINRDNIRLDKFILGDDGIYYVNYFLDSLRDETGEFTVEVPGLKPFSIEHTFRSEDYAVEIKIKYDYLLGDFTITAKEDSSLIRLEGAKFTLQIDSTKFIKNSTTDKNGLFTEEFELIHLYNGHKMLNIEGEHDGYLRKIVREELNENENYFTVLMTPKGNIEYKKYSLKMFDNNSSMNRAKNNGLDSVNIKAKINGTNYFIEELARDGLLEGKFNSGYIGDGHNKLEVEAKKSGYKEYSETYILGVDFNQNQFEVPLKPLRCLPKWPEKASLSIAGGAILSYTICKIQAEKNYDAYQNSIGTNIFKDEKDTKSFITAARVSLSAFGASSIFFALYHLERKKRERNECQKEKQLTLDFYSPFHGTYGLTMVKKF